MTYKVEAWVRDRELETTLNEYAEQGWKIKEMFRNKPGMDGLETTTIIFERYESCGTPS